MNYKSGSAGNSVLWFQHQYYRNKVHLMSLKLRLDLYSRRWLKPNLSLVNIFIPNESLISKIFLLTGLIDFNNALQKI